MTVYVDDMQVPYRGMIMCHMWSEDTAELLHMADLIGVHRKWLQDPGTYRAHFDISKAKRALAVQEGAVQITQMEMGRLIRRHKERKGAEDGHQHF